MNIPIRRSLVYLGLCLFAFQSFAGSPDLSWAKTVGAGKVPTNKKIYNVTDYGANPGRPDLQTNAIQQAIDACASQGGGIVTFAPGKYQTGALYLKTGVHFQVPKGVVLLGSKEIKDYPEINTRVAGIEMQWPSALINVLDQENVLLSGDGVIDGQGKVFWESYWNMREEYESKGLRWIVDYDCKRPRTLLISNSKDISVKGLTFRQAGFWTIQLLYSSYCTIDGIVIQNNIGGKGPSTDGVDIDSSNHILVENCDIDCNDDNFCLKAGRDADGLRVNRPTEYVVIRNCLSRAGGGLLTCGSETSGGIRYVLAENLKAKGTTVGIRLKSAMNRGGTTEHIYVRNVEMESVGTAFEAIMNWNPSYSYSELPKEYEGKDIPDHWEKMLENVPVHKGTPYFRQVYLSDLVIKNANQFISVSGSAKSKMKDFQLDRIKADVAEAGTIDYAENWTIREVRIQAKDGQNVKIENSRNVVFPENPADKAVAFPYSFKKGSATIAIARHPEFAFLLPEMGGNLKFGISIGNESKWLSDFQTVRTSEKKGEINYHLSDRILGKGILLLRVLNLSDSEGIVLECEGTDLPEKARLFWSYGGGSDQLLQPKETGSLKPAYCENNVFSVERSSFTLYYGENRNLKTIHVITPVSSEIRLSDAYVQDSPNAFFASGKKTRAPALTGMVPLVKNQKEYFCVYRQNAKADYNHYLLPDLFKKEADSRK